MIVTEDEARLLEACKGGMEGLELWWMTTTTCTINEIIQERPLILKEMKSFLFKVHSKESMLKMESDLNTYLLTPKGYDDLKTSNEKDGNFMLAYLRVSIKYYKRYISG